MEFSLQNLFINNLNMSNTGIYVIRSVCILLVLLTIVVFTGCRQTTIFNAEGGTLKPDKSLTQKEMLDDFEYMYTILKENYPFFEVNKRVNKIDWLGKKSEYINLIKNSENDERFLSSLSFILKELNNGHTHMVENKQQYENYKRNEGEKGPWFEQLNSKNAIQRYLNIPEKEPLSKGSSTQKSSLSNITAEIIDSGKIAYLKINSFSHLRTKEDQKIILLFLSEVKDYRALIIDIRGNGGGSDSYWIENIVSKLIKEPVSYKYYYTFRGGSFVEKFVKFKLGFEYKDMKPIESLDKKFIDNSPPELVKDFKYYYEFANIISPKESVNFKGKIYLLVDKKVFSSAESFAVFAKSTKFASIVGERTGGDGIGIGPVLCVLPNSGYIFRFSHVMGLNSNGVCNSEFKTAPDIVTPVESDSNILNDKAIQYILNIEN